jgi:hypothetical protein
MSWLGIVVVIIGLYLAFKVVSMVLKIALWLLVIAAGYWCLSSFFGWPPLTEVVQVLGP